MNLSDAQKRVRLERLEAEARDHPRRHALRLGLLIALGYAGPALLLAACVAAVAILLWVGANTLSGFSELGVLAFLAALVASLAAALALGFVLAEAFCAAVPPPGDPELRPHEAAPLRAMIDELRATRPGFPPIDHIHLTHDLNAGVVQRRRFGLFGPSSSHLIVGLPLLLAVTPEQFRAVLAHEFVHLDRAHSASGAWVYRIYQTWAALSNRFSGKLRGWFFRWYEPRLAIGTLPLRRRHEYLADAGSAEIAGLDQAASALVAIGWAGYRLNRIFWPEVRRSASADALPPADIVGKIADFLQSPPPQEASRRYRRHELATRTPVISDHPCLADRLQAMGRLSALGDPDRAASPPAPALALPDTAIILLGDARARATNVVNAAWKGEVIGGWRQLHAAAKQAAKDDPDEAVKDETPAERAWRESAPAIDRATQAEAMTMLHEFLARHPEHPPASFMLGEMLLNLHDEPAATPHFEAAMRGDSDCIAGGLGQLLDYYRLAGRDDEAEPYRVRFEAHMRSLEAARKERLTVSVRDRLEPHGLPTRQVERVRRVVRLFPQIDAAYLARKEVNQFADKPCYVLGVVRRGGRFADKRDKFMVESLRAQVGLPCAVVNLSTCGRRLRGRVIAACPEPIFFG